MLRRGMRAVMLDNGRPYDFVPKNEIGTVTYVNRDGYVTVSFPQGKVQGAAQYRFGVLDRKRRDAETVRRLTGGR